MNLNDLQQGSQDWLKARCGLVTASRFSDVLATTKSGEAASRRNYKAELVAERLTGLPYPTYESAPMRFGTEQEPFARIAYEARTGNAVQQVGFIRHSELLVGASPDGLIGVDGGIEIKVPNTATHIETLLKGMSPDHTTQIQGNIWMSERQWWDFCSYDPRMPERYQLYIQRIKRDDAYIKSLDAAVRTFAKEVDEIIAKLEAMK